MTKEELREKRNRTIETLDDIKAVLGLEELYIDELEKENAELKNKLEHRNCVDCSNHGSNIKLLKAREIIKRFSAIRKTSYLEGEEELFVEAEQFLKEIEK